MKYFYLIISIFFLSVAHYIKIVRQSQFIEIYEKPSKQILSKALSITFILNMILPFKIGNIFRVMYPGKYMKNGRSFSLATVVIDILLDFFTITFLYLLLKLIGKNTYNNVLFYLIVSGIIIILGILSIIFKKRIKKIILSITSIFNQSIKLKSLKTVWYTIISFKDMLKRINKWKLLFNTVTSMSCYLISYFFLARFFNRISLNISFTDIFNMMYGRKNLFNPTIAVFYKSVKLEGLLYLLLYISVPIIIIFISSYFYKNNKKKEKEKKYIQLFPQVHSRDRLVFLEEYFSAEKGKYLDNYLKINRDVAIIEDYSAGSNATTMLCSKDDKAFYRKYAVGKDADKLYEQIEWLKEHKNNIKLTDIIEEYNKNGICYYDMPFVKNSVTCFNYIHTMPFEDTKRIIYAVLEDLRLNLHTINQRKGDSDSLDNYLDKKVIANIEKIKKSSYIKKLLKYKTIYINGKKYHNLDYFIDKYLNKEYLKQVFANDEYSDIHGDFTIENIICIKDKVKRKGNYYIIDPNTGNIHDSPYLDFAKLLQSVHGGYEFLMNTKEVQYYDNNIYFLFTKSKVYDQLFEYVYNYLDKEFGSEGVKSIFYHEIIHWLRLLPYKIEKNGDRALLFYAGLIMVMSDVEKRFER